jgi:hypothetical protein
MEEKQTMKKGSSFSQLQHLLARLRRFFWRKPEPESERGDPFAGVRSPKRRGPQNRSGAVALVEPSEDEYRSFPPRSL